jgi:hypothetical protein
MRVSHDKQRGCRSAAITAFNDLRDAALRAKSSLPDVDSRGVLFDSDVAGC